MVDPNLLVNAFAVPNGRCRKMLTVLAYGRWCNYTEQGFDAEQEAIEEFVASQARRGRPVEVGGPVLEGVHNASRNVRAVLEDALPVETPTELGLVVSDALFKAVGNVVATRRRRQPELRFDVIRGVLANAAVNFVHLGDEALPPVLPDPRSDYLLYTAVRGHARYLITNDAAILAPGGRPRAVSGQASTSCALDLESFIDKELSKYPFDLDEVDGALFGPAATGGSGRRPTPH